MTKTIEIVVSTDGSTKLETKGFSGADCREASRALETSLGLRQGEQLTVEFYQGAANSHRVQQEQ